MGKLQLVRTGDELIQTIEEKAKSMRVRSGSLYGIGAMSSIELGRYNPKTKDYARFSVNEQVELTSLVGNIAYSKENNKIIVHAHATVAKADGSVLGGHVFSGIADPFVELFLDRAERVQYKRFNPTFQLNQLVESEKDEGQRTTSRRGSKNR